MRAGSTSGKLVPGAGTRDISRRAARGRRNGALGVRHQSGGYQGRL